MAISINKLRKVRNTSLFPMRGIICLIVVVSLIRCIFFECITSTALADDIQPTDENVINFVKSGIPPSGEMTIGKTIFDPQSYPASKEQVANATITLKYHAIWRGSNFALQQITPESAMPTNKISGLLVGQIDELCWNAVGDQLNLFSRTNNPPSGAYDNDVNRLVDVGRSLTLAFLKGFDFQNSVWNGSHFTAKVDGIAVEGDIGLALTHYRLTGKITERGETGQFRIDYFDWAPVGNNIYPRKSNVYMKFPGDSDYKQTYAVEIMSFRVPLSNVEDKVFAPDNYLDKTYFRTYAYISNKVYFIGNAGAVKVRDIPIPMLPGKAPKTFFWMIIIITTLVFPTVIFLKLKSNKQQ